MIRPTMPVAYNGCYHSHDALIRKRSSHTSRNILELLPHIHTQWHASHMILKKLVTPSSHPRHCIKKKTFSQVEKILELLPFIFVHNDTIFGHNDTATHICDLILDMCFDVKQASKLSSARATSSCKFAPEIVRIVQPSRRCWCTVAVSVSQSLRKIASP